MKTHSQAAFQLNQDTWVCFKGNFCCFSSHSPPPLREEGPGSYLTSVSRYLSFPQTVHCCSSSFQPLSETLGFRSCVFKASSLALRLASGHTSLGFFNFAELYESTASFERGFHSFLLHWLKWKSLPLPCRRIGSFQLQSSATAVLEQ